MANPFWAATANGSWATAGNFNPSGVPATADSVFMFSNPFDVNDGFAQSAVTLALWDVERSFTGDVGTAAAEMAIGATLWNLGDHTGSGSPAGTDRFKVNFGTVQFTGNVYHTASSAADANLEPCRVRGTHASNVLNVFGGIVGVATNDPDDVATLLELNQSGGSVKLGAGCTLTTLNLDGAGSVLQVNSAFTTLNQNAGKSIIYGAGAATMLSLRGDTCTHKSTGTVTTANVMPGATLNKWSGEATIITLNLYGKLDLSQASGVITLTTANVLGENAEVYDPAGRLAADTAFVMGPGVRTFKYTGPGGETVTYS